eukprot:8300065-Alexandrium_andersonii.AAC.1
MISGPVDGSGPRQESASVPSSYRNALMSSVSWMRSAGCDGVAAMAAQAADASDTVAAIVD